MSEGDGGWHGVWYAALANHGEIRASAQEEEAGAAVAQRETAARAVCTGAPCKCLSAKRAPYAPVEPETGTGRQTEAKASGRKEHGSTVEGYARWRYGGYHQRRYSAGTAGVDATFKT